MKQDGSTSVNECQWWFWELNQLCKFQLGLIPTLLTPQTPQSEQAIHRIVHYRDQASHWNIVFLNYYSLLMPSMHLGNAIEEASSWTHKYTKAQYYHLERKQVYWLEKQARGKNFLWQVFRHSWEGVEGPWGGDWSWIGNWRGGGDSAGSAENWSLSC